MTKRQPDSLYGHLRRSAQAQNEFPKYHQVIKRLGEFVGEYFTVDSIHKSNYLQHIAIYARSASRCSAGVSVNRLAKAHLNINSAMA